MSDGPGLSRCWRQSQDTFHPYAVKESLPDDEQSCLKLNREAAAFNRLRGLPGVLQGEGKAYMHGQQVYTIVK